MSVSPAPGRSIRSQGSSGDVGTLPGWQGLNLVEELQQEFGVPVAVENDADAAALAEAHWGAAKGSERFIYITISTGIGGGIIFSGKLYRGADGAHPELGHQVIDASGPLCYCRARGCWESLASGVAMTAWMRSQQPGAPELSAAQICALAEQGDPLARRSSRGRGHYLGLGLANLITLFTPDAIALGGGVMKSSHLFLAGRARSSRRFAPRCPRRKPGLLSRRSAAIPGSPVRPRRGFAGFGDDRLAPERPFWRKDVINSAALSQFEAAWPAWP